MVSDLIISTHYCFYIMYILNISHFPRTSFICFNESPLKMLENAFSFILKALFVLTIFKFLCLLLGHVEKTALWRHNLVNKQLR